VTLFDVGRKVYSTNKQCPASKPRVVREFSFVDWDGIARSGFRVDDWSEQLGEVKKRVPDL